MTSRVTASVAVALFCCISTVCRPADVISTRNRPVGHPPTSTAAVDELQRRTFQWFWDVSNPKNGLVPDRAPNPAPAPLFSSIAAVGFGLTAYGVGAERGYITRDQAAQRTLTTLRFFLDAPKGEAASGVTGYHGFFYHFLDMDTGLRYKDVELSTIDTTLFLAGALFAQSYFDRDTPVETEIRNVAEQLYEAADWTWTQVPDGTVSMGWKPEDGFINYQWRGLDEAMILYILALGSDTHPISETAWPAWAKTYRWGTYYGQDHVGFAPLFGHQYSQVWIDFRGIQDAYMRDRGIDYFENSRRATLAHRSYAIDNPMKWDDYGENIWGLTACYGPVNASLTINGVPRKIVTYTARGADFTGINDDGTIAPTAAASSIAFAPEIVIPTITAMESRYGDNLFSTYGFVDAFNPTLKDPSIHVEFGKIVSGSGWFDTSYLGIDQGPIVAMIENHRSELIWKTMRRNPHVIRGLKRAGFTGGWLESAK